MQDQLLGGTQCFLEELVQFCSTSIFDYVTGRLDAADAEKVEAAAAVDAEVFGAVEIARTLDRRIRSEFLGRVTVEWAAQGVTPCAHCPAARPQSGLWLFLSREEG